MKKISLILKKYKLTKYQKLLLFFGFLMLILLFRLFYLQVLAHSKYYNLLISQHFRVSELLPERGNIYLEDKNGNPIPLTDNINLYEIYADPYIIWDKQKVSKLLTPILYKHFCERYKLDKPTKYQCVKNVEKFTKESFIKENLQTTLTGEFKQTDFERDLNLDYISTGVLFEAINQRLSKLLEKGYITRAYLGIYDDNTITKLKQLNLKCIEFVNNNYVYVNLDKIDNFDFTVRQLYKILHEANPKITVSYLTRILNKRPRRYVKIVDYVNPLWIDELKKLKKKFKDEKKNQIPLFHGVGFKKQPFRYYPLGTFLSHVIGYVDNGKGVLGVEEYYDDLLRGEKGKIMGMDTPWIGKIGSTNLQIKPAKNGADIYLTIDFNIQKKLEDILKKYYFRLKPDSISAVIMNPFNGQIVALAEYPNFDPNNWKEIYKIKPLTKEYEFLITGDLWETYVDIPILVEKDGKLKVAILKERTDPNLKKYIYKNLLGPRTFVNQIISSPYEPGSIFKTITEAIGVDVGVISLYDYYTDKGEVQVGPYKIRNVAKECRGYNTFLHALEWSCNVGMVYLVKKIGKDIFYNYLQQLGFGKITGIQLAGEEPGKISALEHFSLARFFNNSFGQGLLTTPLQIAVAYSAIVNGGYLVKPTIVKKIKQGNKVINIGKYIVDKVFSSKTSKEMLYALYSVVYNGDLKKLAIKGFTIGGKTGTTQIAFKGKYQKGNGWTIGSFAGIVTKDNLKYVIVIRTNRPRTCQWGICTSGKIFKEIAEFIIKYEGIEK